MLDTYDTHNPLNPINEIEWEPQTELEEQQQWNHDLVAKINKLRLQLEKLAEIEQCVYMFGTMTHEQLIEKKTILNKYIK